MEFDADLLAYCGIYCEQCSFKTAGETQNRAHLMKMPEKYKDIVLLELSALTCEGCKRDNTCGDCRIKDCASTKGIVCCAKCSSFPCIYLIEFSNDGIPHHKRAIENLREIRQNGLESWFATLQNELRCSCGERQSWYYKCDCSKSAAAIR